MISDPRALLDVAQAVARAMSQRPPDPPAIQAFFERVLHRPRSEGGRHLWPCFSIGIITRTELRSAVIAYLATWISYGNAVCEPPADAWCTPELERRVDAALFPFGGPESSPASAGDVASTLDAIATARRKGALLRLEPTRASIARSRERGGSDASLVSTFVQSAEALAIDLPCAMWSRIGWSGLGFALVGARDALLDSARSVMTLLLRSPESGRLSWQMVLTRIWPGDAIRTTHCDAGYDLAKLSGSFIAWVEPYPGDDWKEPQRYPTTTVVLHVPGDPA
jgi:hypothetical protein